MIEQLPEWVEHLQYFRTPRGMFDFAAGYYALSQFTRAVHDYRERRLGGVYDLTPDEFHDALSRDIAAGLRHARSMEEKE